MADHSDAEEESALCCALAFAFGVACRRPKIHRAGFPVPPLLRVLSGSILAVLVLARSQELAASSCLT